MGALDRQIGKPGAVTRRALVRAAAASGTLLAAPHIVPTTARAQTGKLRILRWKNFVAASESWFNDVFVNEWADQNGVEVEVTNVGLGEVDAIAAAEAEAGAGHDLVQFVGPRAALEDHVIDHRELIEECTALYGDAAPAVHKACLNPKSGAYHGFPESVFPTMVTYRKDLWDAVGMVPSSWEDVRKGGRAIKLLQDTPAGFSFAPEHNAEHTLRALMNSFGSFVQNEDNQIAIDSAGTVEALSFAKALFEESMTEDVLSWSPPSNNQFMLAGAGNLTIDTMSIIRAAEANQHDVNAHLALSLLPEGPNGRLGPMFGLSTYGIWKFAENGENAKKFLIDLMGRFEEVLAAGGFQNVPVYPGAAPHFDALVEADNDYPGRYRPLLGVFDTMSNLGHPGNSNAAINEVVGGGFVPAMFSAVVTGAMSPQDAIGQTVAGITPIFEKWRSAGKI